MGKKPPKRDRVRDFDELGTARITRAINRGIRRSLALEAAYRRVMKKKIR